MPCAKHNTVPPVGIETKTSRFGFRCSTTTPPHSPHFLRQIKRTEWHIYRKTKLIEKHLLNNKLIEKHLFVAKPMFVALIVTFEFA